jgi:hypothetical protein
MVTNAACAASQARSEIVPERPETYFMSVDWVVPAGRHRRRG